MTVGTCRKCGRLVDVLDGKVLPHGHCAGAGCKPRGQL